MHGNRLIGALFAVAAAGLLYLTTTIIHDSGMMQGTTDKGREALGFAAIGVHLVGVAVCGLAVGALWGRQWLGVIFFALVMLGSAAVSAYYISGFALSETMASTRAREASEKAAATKRAAEMAIVKQRQDMQAKLAEQQLKIIQGEAQRAKGRSSRKDAMEAGNKLVADVVGATPVMVTAAPEQVGKVQSDVLPETIASLIGWNQSAVQLSSTLYLALALIILEMLCWPAAAFFWRRPAAVAPIVDAMPIAAPQRAVEADLPRAEALTPAEPIRALPAPETAIAPLTAPVSDEGGQPEPPPPPKPTKTGPLVRPPRVPISAEARDVLAGLGMPEVKPVGPVLERQAAAVSAERFSVWLKCVGESGRHSTARLMELYAEFCAADHREPVPYNGQKGLAAALDNRRLGVSKTRLVQADGSSAVEWVIGPFRPKKAKEPREAKAPDADDAPPAIDPRKPETMPHNRLGPMTPSKMAEYQADLAGLQAVAKQEGPSASRPPFGLSAAAFGWSAGKGEPAWLHANAKEMRRWRLAQNHKQRGGQRRVA